MRTVKSAASQLRDNLLTLLGVLAVAGAVAYVLCRHVLGTPAVPYVPFANHEPPAEDNLKTTGTPLQRDLANGVFRSGDALDALVTKHPPRHRIDHPPFVTLIYSEGPLERDTLPLLLAVTDIPVVGGVKVAAKDGRLRAAITNVERDPQAPSNIRVLMLDLSQDWLGEYGQTLVPALMQPHAAVAGVWVHQWFRIDDDTE